MKSKKIKNYLVIILFLICGVLSVIFANKVRINYNLSNYLADDTETKIALEIIDDEFGMTGNIQVMVSNVSVDTAEEICEKIENVNNVLNVNFDKYDENYFKDNNALYVVLVDGDDYSDEANQVSTDIKKIVENYDDVNFGGSIIEKENLKKAITSEMVYIVVIAVCLVAIILLITSVSWIEPIILLVSSGIAILINKGTNIIFGEISYITNSISAVLQLALSIDYSIVLLSAYRKIKKEETDSSIAMKKALKSMFSPISASSLTTIAGLLALLFMSFKIGFDIGIVLMKGIVISVLTSLTLLPTLVVVFDKLFNKTHKKAFNPKGKIFAKLSLKYAKLVLAVSLGIIIISIIGQTKVNYSFSDSKAANTNITDIFGNNNSVVVVYKNSDNNYYNEEKLISELNKYKKTNGEDVLKSYTAYTNTVREMYDTNTIAKKLEIKDSQALMLSTMYNLYKNPLLVELTFAEFVDYAYFLVQNDEDCKDIVEENTFNLISMLEMVSTINNESFTSNEFVDAINKLNNGNEISSFSVKQLYGLYQYDSIQDDKVNYQTMLNFIVLASQNENLKSMFTIDTITALTNLDSGINELVQKCETNFDKSTTKEFFKANYNIDFTDEDLTNIYDNYYSSKGENPSDSIPYLNLMEYFITLNYIKDEETINNIKSYRNIYDLVNEDYSYGEFLDITKLIVNALYEDVSISSNELLIEQLYILYFYQTNILKDIKINGCEFINFILDTANTNMVVKSQLDDLTVAKLGDLMTMFSLFNDENKLSYLTLSKYLYGLENKLETLDSKLTLDEAKISGVYIKYSCLNNLGLTDSMMAFELLDFITSNMDSNSILKSKIDDEKKVKIEAAKNNIAKAEALFVSDNYSRMLLSLDLSNESSETTDFVEYLSKEVKEIFGSEAYITGEIVSINDLKSSFSHDNLLITIFTLISILIIVALVFRSASIPPILVIIIEGAIFIAMSTQILSNNIFFMSYIITTCILMGSTIDYGILMSSTYVENRSLYDKAKSLELAIETAMPTIFTSGLILIVCGFVICFVSSQASISTVGRLIGIGTICSVLMILIVLPSALNLLDKFVLKLTYTKKKNK